MSHKTLSVTCWSWVTELLELQLPGHNVTLRLALRTCCRSRRRRACSVYLFPLLLNPLERMHWFLLPGDLTSKTAHTCAGRAGGRGREKGGCRCLPCWRDHPDRKEGSRSRRLGRMLKAHKAPPQTHHCSDTCMLAPLSSRAIAVSSLSYL